MEAARALMTTSSSSARSRSGPVDGLVLAGGRALTLSVREFGLLVALAAAAAGSCAARICTRAVWGGALRGGDRSIDVYIHKLRVKLEEALPDWRFIHTHVGFGYRFVTGGFTPFSQRDVQLGNRLCGAALRACRAA